MIEQDPTKLVFLDEAGADMRMDKAYARAEKSKRVKAAKPFQRGQKFSLVSAIGIAGIIDFYYAELSITKDIFTHFIKNMLCSKLQKGQIVIMV